MPVLISGSTGVSGVDGSAASPAFEGVDADTGVFFPSNGAISFTNDGTERMRIAANGNVGISNTTPINTLAVGGSAYFGSGANDFITIFGDSGSMEISRFAGDAYIDFKNLGSEDSDVRLQSSSTGGTFTISTAGTERLRVTNNSSSSVLIGTSSVLGNGGQVNMGGYNAVGGTGYHGLFAFYNSYSTGTNQYKYIRLNSTGGIEVINSAYNAVIFTMANSGDFTASGNITAYSDIRLKANIHPIQDAITKVKQMQGVSYDRKSDSEKKIGFIAQDLQKVLPEVVIENHDGLLSVDYGNIVALLTEAIKEQQQQIENLKHQVKKLEER